MVDRRHMPAYRARHFATRLASSFMAAPAWSTLVVLLIAASFLQPRLLTIPFLLIVLRQCAPLALVAIGQGFPMIGRSIDLSVGGVVAVANVMLALPILSGGPGWASIVVPIVFGAAVGLFNAFLVAVVRCSAVVATLGVSVILIGVSYIVSGGAPGGSVHPVVREIATGRWATVPAAGIAMLVLAVVAAILLRGTVFGRSLYAVGANHDAARLAGLPVRTTLTVAHVLSGMFAGCAAIVLTGYIGTGTLNLGADLVLASVAAVVLGGTAFGGGAGGVAGTVAGAYALSFLGNLMTGAGLGKPSQLIVQGAIVAVAAALATRRR